MLKQVLIALTGLALTAAPASAATVVADFETGLEGFSSGGAALSLSSANGTSGQYLATLDNRGGWGSLEWGSQFFSALTDGGTIGFDATLISANGRDTVPFGEITISGGGLSATVDAVLNGIPPLGQWESYSVSLDAATWGLSQADFTTLLANVSAISMVIESTYGVNERLGFDNFRVSSVETPLPAAGFLFLSAIGAIAARRRG